MWLQSSSVLSNLNYLFSLSICTDIISSMGTDWPLQFLLLLLLCLLYTVCGWWRGGGSSLSLNKSPLPCEAACSRCRRRQSDQQQEPVRTSPLTLNLLDSPEEPWTLLTWISLLQTLCFVFWTDRRRTERREDGKFLLQLLWHMPHCMEDN